LAGRRFQQEKVDHPAQKPLALAERIVGHFSNPGDLVLVPFAGSGTECVSAKLLGRHFWASELEPRYADLARRRLDAVADHAPTGRGHY
jgi:DNA modification methylase